MRVLLVGSGAVGRRVASQLLRDDRVRSLTVTVHRDRRRAELATEGLGDRVTLRSGRPSDVPPGTDVVVVATPAGAPAVARAALAGGAHVVAATDDPHETREMVALDAEARAAGRSLVVGAAMAPGLSGVLARWAATSLDRVDEVHVASFGTGGPSCARHHHRALSSTATEWYDGAWRRRPGGSGRELVWFPEPVGGADCYRGRLADPELLCPAFPSAGRVSARMEATRRDRFTSPLPMLRRPHPEGTVGAVRVELRGRRGPAAETVVVGAVGRPALVAGTVAALLAGAALDGRLARAGAGGTAEMVADPAAFLREIVARGIPVSRFEGTGAAPDGPAVPGAP